MFALLVMDIGGYMSELISFTPHHVLSVPFIPNQNDTTFHGPSICLFYSSTMGYDFQEPGRNLSCLLSYPLLSQPPLWCWLKHTCIHRPAGGHEDGLAESGSGPWLAHQRPSFSQTPSDSIPRERQ